MTQGSIRTALDLQGLTNLAAVHHNLPTSFLYEEIVRRREARLAHLGPLVVRTGHHTGRAPNDKFVVREPSSEEKIWWGPSNQPLPPERFEALRRRMLAYLQGKDLFIQDRFLCADPAYRTPVRVITETAWHSLFARNLLLQARPDEIQAYEPSLTILHAPHFHAVPEIDGTRSEAFIILHFGHRLVLIGGTAYAGEIKKSAFTFFNYVLPQKAVLSMHAAANFGDAGDVAVFFGLSGTGKTTLSTDPERNLIGDDEIGWSDRGVFNLEGGCYAKVIRISPDDEPEIFQATRRFGTILENVGFDAATGRLDLDDASLTENTRAAYPISHIPRVAREGTGGHPTNILMLTADAFGVLPPIAKLSADQAVYHFLSGYTAKVVGTEAGVVEPKATFSPCFGAPFMALSPTVYARLLGERIARHQADVWLVNTGWTGGPYGTGRRMPISATRALVRAALDGSLRQVPTKLHAGFGVEVPTACAGVPSEILDPRGTWRDPGAYDKQAQRLAELFRENFRQFESEVS
ncbi:MAG: phosphoenolpyruvate carboxykinase (ATP) [Deltaproteobacteria bacterium RBG_13_65_10]|nr:MAG: phosphoenolpyruvate carboxykinase (ATP) [Deltaproteobacteria bacterium RBG_13_65_10]